MRLAICSILPACALAAGLPAHANDWPTPVSVVGGNARSASACATFLTKDNGWSAWVQCTHNGEKIKTDPIAIYGCNEINYTPYQLSCVKGDNVLSQHLLMKNVQAFRSAAVITMGVDPKWTTARTWYQWAFKKHPELQSDDLDFTAAAAALRDYLKTAATKAERDAVVKAAYIQVYGAPTTGGIQIPMPDYDAAIKAGKAWYSTIVIDLRKAKNAPSQPAGPQPPIG